MSEGTGLKLDELRAQRAQLRANMKQVEQEINSSNENGSGSHSTSDFSTFLTNLLVVLVNLSRPCLVS